MKKVYYFLIFIGLLYLYLFSFKLDYQTIPEDMREKIDGLSTQYPNDLEFIEAVYNFVDKKYTSESRQYFKEPNKIFLNDLEKIWNLENEYLICIHQVEIFKIMLIESGRFKEENFINKNGFCYMTPHRYLIVNGIDIDIWLADHIDNAFGKNSKEEGICL